MALNVPQSAADSHARAPLMGCQILADEIGMIAHTITISLDSQSKGKCMKDDYGALSCRIQTVKNLRSIQVVRSRRFKDQV